MIDDWGVANIFALPSKDEVVTSEKASKPRQMQFRDKTGSLLSMRSFYNIPASRTFCHPVLSQRRGHFWRGKSSLFRYLIKFTIILPFSPSKVFYLVRSIKFRMFFTSSSMFVSQSANKGNASGPSFFAFLFLHFLSLFLNIARKVGSWHYICRIWKQS